MRARALAWVVRWAPLVLALAACGVARAEPPAGAGGGGGCAAGQTCSASRFVSKAGSAVRPAFQCSAGEGLYCSATDLVSLTAGSAEVLRAAATGAVTLMGGAGGSKTLVYDASNVLSLGGTPSGVQIDSASPRVIINNSANRFEIRGAPGQTGNLQEWNVNAGSAVASLSPTGVLTTYGLIITTNGAVVTGTTQLMSDLDARGSNGVYNGGGENDNVLFLGDAQGTTVFAGATAGGFRSQQANLGGALYIDATQYSTPDAAENTPTNGTYTLPASSLVANGRCVRVRAFGTSTNSANAKTVKLRVGGTALSSLALAINTASHWRAEAEVCRTGASAQDYEVRYEQIDTAAGAIAKVGSGLGSLTATETGALVVDVRVQGGAAGELVYEGMRVDYL